MTSYHQLELLTKQRIQTLMAEAASEQLAVRVRSANTRTFLRKRIASAISGLVGRLEPTPIQAELIEACSSLSEWVR
jgi:hypothetical protein